MKRAILLLPLAGSLLCTSCGLEPLGNPNPLDSTAHLPSKPRDWDGLRFLNDTKSRP